MRFDLIAEAMAFKERYRVAKTTGALRAARQNFRDAFNRLRSEGAPIDVVEEISTLLR